MLQWKLIFNSSLDNICRYLFHVCVPDLAVMENTVRVGYEVEIAGLNAGDDRIAKHLVFVFIAPFALHGKGVT